MWKNNEGDNGPKLMAVLIALVSIIVGLSTYPQIGHSSSNIALFAYQLLSIYISIALRFSGQAKIALGLGVVAIMTSSIALLAFNCHGVTPLTLLNVATMTLSSSYIVAEKRKYKTN